MTALLEAPSTYSENLRKPVNTLALVPRSAKITMLLRKSYNVLLFNAQEQGLEQDVFRMPLDGVIRGVDFDSNDHALIKKHLRSMVSTTVEWQSPTTGEGASWNVSGLLAHAKLSKVRGQVWIEWSYAVNLKQELLAPTVFAKLQLDIIARLRSHAGVALYEICARYKGVGRTSRQAWRWWHPVLTGNPPSDRTERLEYRIFKRDTLKPAMAEVTASSDLEVELIEHRQGRFVTEIQFAIRPKTRPLGQATTLRELEPGIIARAVSSGLTPAAAAQLGAEHGEEAFVSGLEILERRVATSFPAPLRDPARYLKSLLEARHGEMTKEAQPVTSAVDEDARQIKRRAKWIAEWVRRRRERCEQEISALGDDAQLELTRALVDSMEAVNAHPSLINRIHTHGWRHAMIKDRMIQFYAAGAYGENWNVPTPEQLLGIAASEENLPS